MGDTIPISTRLPASQIKQIDKLVEAGIFLSRAEALRAAIREFLKSYGDKDAGN